MRGMDKNYARGYIKGLMEMIDEIQSNIEQDELIKDLFGECVTEKAAICITNIMKNKLEDVVCNKLWDVPNFFDEKIEERDIWGKINLYNTMSRFLDEIHEMSIFNKFDIMDKTKEKVNDLKIEKEKLWSEILSEIKIQLAKDINPRLKNKEIEDVFTDDFQENEHIGQSYSVSMMSSNNNMETNIVENFRDKKVKEFYFKFTYDWPPRFYMEKERPNIAFKVGDFIYETIEKAIRLKEEM